jgi:NAD(P)H-dependent FMN reductase
MAEAPSDVIRVLGFAGSLRKASYNRALLAAARALAPRPWRSPSST